MTRALRCQIFQSGGGWLAGRRSPDAVNFPVSTVQGMQNIQAGVDQSTRQLLHQPRGDLRGC